MALVMYRTVDKTNADPVKSLQGCNKAADIIEIRDDDRPWSDSELNAVDKENIEVKDTSAEDLLQYVEPHMLQVDTLKIGTSVALRCDVRGKDEASCRASLALIQAEFEAQGVEFGVTPDVTISDEAVEVKILQKKYKLDLVKLATFGSSITKSEFESCILDKTA